MLNNDSQECEQMASGGMRLASHASTKAIKTGHVLQTAANAEKAPKHFLRLGCLHDLIMQIKWVYSTYVNTIIAYPD